MNYQGNRYEVNCTPFIEGFKTLDIKCKASGRVLTFASNDDCALLGLRVIEAASRLAGCWTPTDIDAVIEKLWPK